MRQELPKVWRSECGSYTVTISEKAVSSMLKLARERAPHEVGSSLVGSYSDDGYEATIHSLAPIPTDSRSSMCTFIRGVEGLPDFFQKMFRRFGGKRHYVGEWHTHPNAPANPSSTDDENQFRIAADKGTDCPEAILVILGGKLSSSPQLGVYVYSRSGKRETLSPR